jgi:feruloyl-CoA synthase
MNATKTHLMAPYRPIALWDTPAVLEHRIDGSMRMHSEAPLADYPSRMSDKLLHWARQAPERTLIAKRDAQGQWQRLSYAQTLAAAERIGQALMDRGLSAERPLVILSENDLEHFLLSMGAMHVGVPYAPISSAYSLVSKDFDKLKHIIDLLTPGAVFVASGARYGAALSAAVPADVEVIYAADAPAGRARVSTFATLNATPASTEVERARLATGPDTIAKFLFTSGSTNAPKGVINTQRMLCSNQQMIAQAWPFLADAPPVLVDWLPWNHTFGGNHNIGITLYHGGTLYMDDGKPVPQLFSKTIENLREIAPTVYFNVPRGFEELAHALDADAALAEHFFSKLKMWFFAGASLPQPVLDHLQRVAVRTIGQRISMQSGLGMTETAPWAIGYNALDCRAGYLGIPGAGMTLKLVPNAGKTELRYKGDNLTPGYWRAPALTAEAFDEEGYFKSGDAVRVMDPSNPTLGLAFDGRIAEDFKLITGTWVSVGPLRGALIARGAPYVQDAVITGHDRDTLGAIIIPHLDSCRKCVPSLLPTATLSEVLATDPVRSVFARLVSEMKRDASASSNRIVHAVLLAEPLSLDKGEVTDKGSVNQRAVLAHRSALVDAMYAGTAPHQLTLE